MGSIFDALHAGYMPATMLTIMATSTADIMVDSGNTGLKLIEAVVLLLPPPKLDPPPDPENPPPPPALPDLKLPLVDAAPVELVVLADVAPPPPSTVESP